MGSINLQGAKELDRVLQSLSAVSARNVTRRALAKSVEPVAEAARSIVTRDTGDLANSIEVSTRLTKRQAREARGTNGKSVQTIFVGSNSRIAHLVEFGTGPRFKKSGAYVGVMPPKPFVRPAWDAKREEVLDRLTDDIRSEIQKTLARAAKRSKK